MDVQYEAGRFHIFLYEQAPFGSEIKRLANAPQITSLTTPSGTNLAKRVELCIIEDTHSSHEVRISFLGEEEDIPSTVERCLGLRISLGRDAYAHLLEQRELHTTNTSTNFSFYFQIRPADPARIHRN